ncbi:hypothetical protein [Erysipelothrix tonsillarum]|uniref:hypothetical protein n=1 Tax=Erysipelothrix tonsillarum TaxID=38402 RepID=UPI0039C7694D
MDKTITEIAKELSVSRQAIHQSIDKLLDKEKLKKRGNSYLLNPKQQKVIIESFQKPLEEELSSKLSSELSSNLINTLQTQNDFLSKEIENKNKQINELHILLLKEKENNLLLISEKEEIKEEDTKKSFLKKLFGK